MMATTSNKNKLVVNKDDLRRLMKEKSKGVIKDTKKIDSPLAKYDSLGNLYCILCNAKVKNHLVWNAHVMGRTHKETVQRLKEEQHRKATAPAPPPDLPKKQKPPKEIPPAPKPKGILKNAPKRKVTETSQDDETSKPSKSSKTSALKLGGYESSDDNDEDDKEEKETKDGDPVSDLPADFFDQGVAPSKPTDDPDKKRTKRAGKKKDKKQQESPETIAEKLPEGFFDDAKMDAKVRNVEYRDKMDDEWDMFQKEIKSATMVSEAIAEEESEVIQADKDIEMVDEQLFHLKRVTEIAKKKETTIKVKDKEKPKEEENSDVSSEEDLEELLNCDWRTKQA